MGNGAVDKVVANKLAKKDTVPENGGRADPGLVHSFRHGLNNFLLSLDERVGLRVLIGIVVILFMANLDAIIDAVIHPGIPYFDEEHLIVGGMTGLVTTVLFGLLSIYVASLKRASREIKRLEGLLPICSSCHKIRTPDNEWHVLEKYITERTEAVFTHSLCPDCAKTLYPEMFEKQSSHKS
jgi:hypothetical protein